MSYISNEILISLLKQYGIKKLVLSSGARNIPFVNAVEVDNAFECFSVIDERNAAFLVWEYPNNAMNRLRLLAPVVQRLPIILRG